MAKYNLLDDDDIFDEKEEMSFDENKPASQPKTSESNVDRTEDIDINIDDDNLEAEPVSSLDDQDFQTDLDITAIDNDESDEEVSEPEIEDNQPREYEEYQPESDNEEKQEYKDSPPFLTDDYEDEKQEGINYKPFIIATIIIVILAGIYFVLDTFVFSDNTEVVKEPVKTPEQIQQEKEAAEKAALLGKISGKTLSDINIVSQILTYGKNNAKVSSILLYDQSLLFEVFGKTRDQVARVNMSLRDNMTKNPFEVIGSETRPGSKGGVFGLFKTNINQSASSKEETQEKFTSINDFESWIKQTSGAAGLNTVLLKNKYLTDEGPFRKFSVEANIDGPIDGCDNFLQKLSSENNQVKINKLNLTAADQRNFQAKKYQLKLLLEFYL